MIEFAVVLPLLAMTIARCACRRSSKLRIFACRRIQSTKLLAAELPIQVNFRKSYLVSAALMTGASANPVRPGMPSVNPSGLTTL
jgi:hypothetical protein